MPTKKKAEPKSEATPKAARTDAQGHPKDGPDFIPTADEYDPAKHANHSHFIP